MTIENTKKSKSLIEKIWWMIPISIVLTTPLIASMILGGEDTLRNWWDSITRFSVITIYYILGVFFVVVGFFITKNRSLILRILISSGLGILVYWIFTILVIVLTTK